ncbi:uncharacterized protein RCH25_018279 [Pelodytes ibericus]
MRNAYLSREDKRLMKPVIEKKRRDRINQSLEHLRVLLLESTKDESLKNPKTEKVDILTKTVQFLKMCHHPGLEEPKKTKSCFKGGYQEGLSQAATFLTSTATISETKRDYVVEKLCQHMEDRSLKRPTADHSSGLVHTEVLPRPPHISTGFPGEVGNVEIRPGSNFCTQTPHSYPTSSSSSETSRFRPALPLSPQKVHLNNSKTSMQRTLLAPSTTNSFITPAKLLRRSKWNSMFRTTRMELHVPHYQDGTPCSALPGWNSMFRTTRMELHVPLYQDGTPCSALPGWNSMFRTTRMELHVPLYQDGTPRSALLGWNSTFRTTRMVLTLLNLGCTLHLDKVGMGSYQMKI